MSHDETFDPSARSPQLAEEFVCVRHDVASLGDLYDNLGYIWNLHEGDGPDGSWTTRPVNLDKELGPRGGGTSRTTYVNEAEARAEVAGKHTVMADK